MPAATVVGAAALWGGAFHPVAAAITGAALTGVLAWSVVRLPRQAASRDEVLAAAFIAWGVLAAVLAGTAPLAAKETVGGWLAALLLWAGVRRSGSGARAAAAAVVALVTALLAVGVLLEWSVFAEPRVGGLLENPNVAAALLVTGVLGALPSLGRRWLRAGLVMLAAVALVGTGSRAGLAAAAVALVVLLPAGRLRRGGAATAAAGVALLAWWRLASVPDPFAWHRPALWRAMLELASHHLLHGVGPGGLPDAAGVVRIAESNPVAVHQWLINYAESTPLAVLVALGLPGLLLAAAAVGAWLMRLRKLGASRWTWAGVGAVTTFALVHDQLEVGVVLWWWALVLGLLDVPWAPRPARPSRWRWLIAATAATALAWSLVQPAAVRLWWPPTHPDAAAVRAALRCEPFFADAPRLLVERALLEGRWRGPAAVDAAYWSERAVAARPGSAALWADEARVYTRIVRELGTWPGATARARRAWGEATAREPDLPWYWYDWALLERSLGDNARARALMQRAVLAEPHFVRGWLLLARLELDLGRMPAASTALARARASRRLVHGRLLTGYERDLLRLPRRQLRELEEALR